MKLHFVSRPSKLSGIAFCLILLITNLPAAKAGTICKTATGGGNFCPSTQYRATPTHSGAVTVDLLGKTSVGTLTQKFTRTTNGGAGVIAPLTNGPTSSPSVITRTIFASQDNNGNWGLWAYGVDGGSLGWNTFTNTGAPMRSSPGYANHNVYGYIFAAGEDGNIYAFGYTDGSLGWTYHDPNDAIDSSPTVTDANEVYVIDRSGVIFKLDGNSGTSIWSNPIYSDVTSSGAATASSVALSTCAGCNQLYVSGGANYGASGSTGIVQAFNSVTGSSGAVWTTTLPNAVSSSPVVNDAQRLVYVQADVLCYAGNCSGQNLVYALRQNNGTQQWVKGPSQVSEPSQPAETGSLSSPPCPNGYDGYRNGGSPAFDAGANIVVAVTNHTYDIYCGGATLSTFEAALLSAYDATTGAPKWPTISIQHPVTYSSPTVANGVVYIGTDDGYVLAYDEITGSSTPLWTSSKMDAAILSPPVISRNRVQVVTQQGTLYVFSLPGD